MVSMLPLTLMWPDVGNSDCNLSGMLGCVQQSKLPSLLMFGTWHLAAVPVQGWLAQQLTNDWCSSSVCLQSQHAFVLASAHL